MSRVIPVPVFDDNYSYLLVAGAPGSRFEGAAGRCVVIDPADGPTLIAALKAHNLTPEAIWCTHHHGDHVGGVEDICAAFGELPVYGSAYDAGKKRIPRQSVALGGPEQWETGFSWGGLEVRVLYVPGHTLGAIAFYVPGDSGESGDLFVGDTLFLGGCGRLFEGTAAVMRESLGRLRALPGDTRLWVGHEYTGKNLRFGLTVDPGNARLVGRLAGLGVPSIPGRMEEERATNPFLRWEALCEAPESFDETFARIRELRNRF